LSRRSLVAIAGFAVIFYKKDRQWLPLRLWEKVPKFCADHECEFRAIPFD